MNYKKESHYFWTATTMIAVYVLFMHYGFNAAWAESSRWIRVINVVQHAIPALRRLHDDVVDVYTNYWGAFFSGFWLISPAYWLLGFIGAPFVKDKRRRVLMLETSIARIALMFAILLFSFIFFYEFPVLNGMGVYDETSRFIPILLLTWWIVAMTMYYHGQSSRILLIRIVSRQAA